MPTHIIKASALAAGLVPLLAAASAIAKTAATAGGTPFHKPTYDGRRRDVTRMLVAAAKRGDLIVRDHCGLSGTAEQVVAQAKKDGIYSECHTMAGEFDEDATLALCLHVIVKDLNSWGEENGNTFAINEDGVEWIDERGVMKAGRQLVEGGAVAKVPATPAIANPTQGKRQGEHEAPLVTDRLVSWQAAVLESWPEILAALGPKPTGRGVMGWLKSKGPRDVFGCTQPNARDCAHWFGRDGLERPLSLSNLQKRISEWKRAGKIPS